MSSSHDSLSHAPPEDAAQQRLRLEVSGMTCAACSARVQRVLERTDGVSGANVNLMTRTAAVDFDPAVTSPEGLVADLKAAGVDARYIPDTADIVRSVARDARSGDLVIVMSNGGFDDIHQKVLTALESRVH